MAAKTVLMVAYHFPPAGGPAVQRPLKFAKYLPQYGWSPVVLTVRDVLELGQSATVDPRLAAEIPSECRVVRTASLDPYRLLFQIKRLLLAPQLAPRGDEKDRGQVHYRIGSHNVYSVLKAVQRFVFFPDDRVMWFPFAFIAGRNLLKDMSVDVLWTTFPPATTALVGFALRRWSGIPWVLDLRDPWLDDPCTSYPTRLHRCLAMRLEKACLETADAIVVVSERMADMVSAKVSETRKVHAIPNGFDAEDFRDAVPMLNECFTIVYTGSLYWHNFRPFVEFLDALKIVLHSYPDKEIRVRFVGRAIGACVQAVQQRGLDGCVEFVGFVPHAQSISHLLGADLALLLVNDSAGWESMVTGKVYEYIGSGVPILAIAPDGDAAHIVKSTNAGVVVKADSHLIARELSLLLKHPPSKELPGKRGVQYERRYLARNLAEILDGLLMTRI